MFLTPFTIDCCWQLVLCFCQEQLTLSLSLLKNTINTARVDRKSITGVVRKKGGEGVQQPGGEKINQEREEYVCREVKELDNPGEWGTGRGVRLRERVSGGKELDGGIKTVVWGGGESGESYIRKEKCCQGPRPHVRRLVNLALLASSSVPKIKFS